MVLEGIISQDLAGIVFLPYFGFLLIVLNQIIVWSTGMDRPVQMWDQHEIDQRREKLKTMISVSDSLTIGQIAKALQMSEDVVMEKIFDWAKEFGFRINKDEIIFKGARVQEFIQMLDQQFDQWQRNERAKIGKI